MNINYGVRTKVITFLRDNISSQDFLDRCRRLLQIPLTKPLWSLIGFLWRIIYSHDSMFVLLNWKILHVLEWGKRHETDNINVQEKCYFVHIIPQHHGYDTVCGNLGISANIFIRYWVTFLALVVFMSIIASVCHCFLLVSFTYVYVCKFRRFNVLHFWVFLK